MSFNKIKLDELKLEDSVSQSKEIILNNNTFYTPKIYVPFGLENYKSSFSMNFQLRNIKKDEELQNFLEFIQDLEDKLKKELNIDDSEFTTQLKYHQKYDPIFFGKFLTRENKIVCEVKNDEGFLNIYDIGKQFYCKCLLHIDKVWLFRGKYSYKFKIKQIYVVD